MLQIGVGIPIATHIDEESLEFYCLGCLSETDVTGLEEHLLICHSCQERLDQTDDFVQTFRLTVAAQAQPEVGEGMEHRSWSWQEGCRRPDSDAPSDSRAQLTDRFGVTQYSEQQG